MKYPATLFLIVLAAALVPCVASAQLVGADAPPEVRRPYRGVFGAFTDSDTPHSLILSASLFGGYDDNLHAGQGARPTVDRLNAISGSYAGAQGMLGYDFNNRTYSVSAKAGAHYRYYRDQVYGAPLYQEAFHTGAPLWKGARVNLNQALIYSSNQRMNLFPGMGDVDNPDEGIEDTTDLDLYPNAAYRHNAGVSLSQRLGQRSDLHGGYSFRYVDFTDSGQPDFRNHSMSARFSHRLSSHAAMRVGYGRSVADRGLEPSSVHNIDAGVDYSRPISLSRRTMLTFSTGSAVHSAQRLGIVEANPQTRFHMIGVARLVHEIGRTWTAGANYRRSLNFREGFDQPLVTDGVTGTVGGLITRRLTLSVTTGYVHAAGSVDGRTGYEAFTASTQLQYALNRFVAMYARYFYYDFEFSPRAALELGVPTSAQRNGVRVGLSTTLPLIR